MVLLRPFYKEDGVTPNFASLLANYYIADQMMEKGIVLSASAVGYGGVAEALFKMGLGNQVGFRMIADMSADELFEPAYGSLVLEIATGAPAGKLLGALDAQMGLGIASIGGKDSMSGSFEDLDVPPRSRAR